MHRSSLLAIVGLMLGIVACQSPDSGAGPARSTLHPTTDEMPSENASTYQAMGIVRSVTPSGSHVVIQHGDIPGFMDAMTMAFAVADSVPVDGLQRGDRIRFGFVAGPHGTIVQSIAQSIAPAERR